MTLQTLVQRGIFGIGIGIGIGIGSAIRIPLHPTLHMLSSSLSLVHPVILSRHYCGAPSYTRIGRGIVVSQSVWNSSNSNYGIESLPNERGYNWCLCTTSKNQEEGESTTFTPQSTIGKLKRSAHHNNDTSTSSDIVSNNIPNNTTKSKYNHQRIPVLLYQDNFAIVSKPAGMTMHHNANSRRYNSRKSPPVFQSAIKKQLSRKPFLVHRLDHRTSGAVIVAFDSETAAELHGRMRDRGSKGAKGEDSNGGGGVDGAKKVYLALVRGDLRDKFQLSADGDIDNGGGSKGVVCEQADSKTGVGTEEQLNDAIEYRNKITINLPIKVDGVQKEAKTDFYFLSSMTYSYNDSIDGITNIKHSSPDAIDSSSKPSLQENTGSDNPPNENNNETPYTNKSLTLLLCHPQTGRTHQIRRHLQMGLQSPIIGDSEHGDSRVNRFWRNEIRLNRLGLHCWILDLPGLDSEIGCESRIQCIAPLPDDFMLALKHDQLRPLWEEAVGREPRLEMGPRDERGGTFGRNHRKRLKNGKDMTQ